MHLSGGRIAGCGTRRHAPHIVSVRHPRARTLPSHPGDPQASALQTDGGARLLPLRDAEGNGTGRVPHTHTQTTSATTSGSMRAVERWPAQARRPPRALCRRHPVLPRAWCVVCPLTRHPSRVQSACARVDTPAGRALRCRDSRQLTGDGRGVEVQHFSHTPPPNDITYSPAKYARCAWRPPPLHPAARPSHTVSQANPTRAACSPRVEQGKAHTHTAEIEEV